MYVATPALTYPAACQGYAVGSQTDDPLPAAVTPVIPCADSEHPACLTHSDPRFTPLPHVHSQVMVPLAQLARAGRPGHATHSADVTALSRCVVYPVGHVPAPDGRALVANQAYLAIAAALDALPAGFSPSGSMYHPASFTGSLLPGISTQPSPASPGTLLPLSQSQRQLALSFTLSPLVAHTLLAGLFPAQGWHDTTPYDCMRAYDPLAHSTYG